MNLYRDFSLQGEIDKQYNALLMIPDLQPYIEFDHKCNVEVRNKFKCVLDRRYGHSLDETVDIFPAKESDAPILVFIHGGYWRSLSSKDFSLIARGLVLNGITVVMPNYSLCPKVSIAEITLQNRAAVSWLYDQGHKFNGDPERIFTCGHSAGGHQAAMLASTDWVGDYGLPSDTIKGCIPISGIFDISPFYHSWLQPTLQLTQEHISNQSPLFQIPMSGPPMLISVGDDESTEFKRQSKDYLSAWIDKGNKGELIIQSDKNHFTTFRDLYDPESKFCNSLVDFIK